jgi:hypothetical protein
VPGGSDKVGAEVPEPGGAGEHPLSDDLERILSDTVAGVHRLLRHTLLGK